MAHRTTSSAFRKLCDPAWLQVRFPSSPEADMCGLEVVSGQCCARGMAREEEFLQLVSSSFHQTLRNMLPYPAAFEVSASSPGGMWFWETYRHALFGENVIVDLGGTGMSLAEDSMMCQSDLRAKLCGEFVAHSPRSFELFSHATSKLEVVYALSLAVSVHVAKLPVLERSQGPQAIVLCATFSQCADFTAALRQFCSSLHLVVHNLFDPYPALPGEKLSDIVVGTPPLWESVSQLVGAGASTIATDVVAHSGGLEDLLLDLRDDGQLPPTYLLNRWRPYRLTNVAQLVLFDVELHVNMGYGSVLQHILQSSAFPTGRIQAGGGTPTGSRLPLFCQQYVVVGGDRFCNDISAVERLLALVRESGCVPANIGTAEIAVSLSIPLSAAGVRHKRQRSEDDAGDDNSMGEQLSDAVEGESRPSYIAGAASPSSECESFSTQGDDIKGLLIRNALSHGRLLTDFGALTDLKHRLITEAEHFWSSFESNDDARRDAIGIDKGTDVVGCEKKPCSSTDTTKAVVNFIQFDLALLCTRADNRQRGAVGIGARSVGQATYRAQEIGVWVRPSARSASTYSSREALLFKHLFDVVNGDLFDGSVVQCFLAEDAALHPFTIRSLPPNTVRATHLALNTMFSYGEDGLQPHLVEIERKSDELATSAATERAKMRCNVAAASDKRATTRRHTDTEVPPTLFLSASSFPTARASHQSALQPVPLDIGTVVVLRHLLLTRDEACGRATAVVGDTTDAPKPFVQRVVEDCCQYGRVLSYHVHEDPLVLPADSSEATQDAHNSVCDFSPEQQPNMDSKASFLGTHKTVVSIFVEFTTPDSAMEATRQFAQRFALQAAQMKDFAAHCPRVRLFRSSVYYQGVSQDTGRAESFGSGNSDENDDGDSLFSDLIPESLLAE